VNRHQCRVDHVPFRMEAGELRERNHVKARQAPGAERESLPVSEVGGLISAADDLTAVGQEPPLRRRRT